MQRTAHAVYAPRPHHPHHAYHEMGFASVRSIGYLLSFSLTPEIKDPKLRLLARAGILAGVGFLERELWRRGRAERDGYEQRSR